MPDRDSLISLRNRLRVRTMGCPFFICGAILPIPTLLMGDIGVPPVQHRLQMALFRLDNSDPEIIEAIRESYYPEDALIRKLLRTFCAYELEAEPDEAAFHADLLRLLEEYLASPEAERKSFILE